MLLVLSAAAWLAALDLILMRSAWARSREALMAWRLAINALWSGFGTGAFLCLSIRPPTRLALGVKPATGSRTGREAAPGAADVAGLDRLPARDQASMLLCLCGGRGRAAVREAGWVGGGLVIACFI